MPARRENGSPSRRSRRKRATDGAAVRWGLQDVLSIEDHDGFMAALWELVEAPPGAKTLVATAFDELPAVVRTVLLLETFWLTVSAGEMTQFLQERVGSSFHEARRSCEKIGAKRVAAYMDATAALFPRGRVPADREKRERILDQLAERRPNPLHALERR